MKRDKTISYIVIIAVWLVTLASLIPLMYCGLFDYATGDDLGKSAKVHQIIIHGGTFFEVIKQAFASAHETYVNHEGTWASNVILALQPSIWGEKFYIITPFLGMLALGIGAGFFLYEILVCRLDYPKTFFWLVAPLFYLLAIQYMPFIRGGLFWYTGMAHYVFPITGSFIYLVLMDRFFKNGKYISIVLAMIFSIYIGGSHYQAYLFSVLVFIPMCVLYVIAKGDKLRVLLGICTQIIQLIGFFFCYKAPGNNQRAESEFGFSFGRAINTVIDSVVQSTADGVRYVLEVRPLVLLAIVLIIAGIVYGNKAEIGVKKLLISTIYAYLVYCAMYAPGIYYASYGASEGISGGYFDTNYFCFLLFVIIASLSLGRGLSALAIMDRIDARMFNIASIVSIALLLILFKHIIGNSAGYSCYTFVAEGHLDDFVSQMEERLVILEDDSIEDAVLPEMNDQQGPFMHMPLSSDPDSFTNGVTSQFYGKKSVIAIPRDEYYEKYGR